MKYKSLIDDKKKQRVRDAIEKEDPTLIWPKNKPKIEQAILPVNQLSEQEKIRLNNQLINAAFTGNLKSAMEALENGADPNAKTDDDWPVLSAAVTNQQLAIVHLLLHSGADIDAKGGALGRTALIIAAEGGSAGMLEKLLSKGANTEARQHEGITAMMYAVRRSSEHADLLISKGADVNAKDDRGMSVIMWGISEIEIVENLFSAGADINSQDNDGRSVLMYAAECGDGKPAEFLISKGAVINARDNSGNTSLMIAASSGNLQAVKILLSAAARAGEQNNDGKTAYDLALENDHEEVAKLLRRR